MSEVEVVVFQYLKKKEHAKIAKMKLLSHVLRIYGPVFVKIIL